MLYRSPKAYQKQRNNTRTTFEPETNKHTQHGIHFLLDVPAEILAAISANLDPKSLQCLAEAHEHFARHVDQDLTWRDAFETHYICNEKSLLLLRRTQPNWRKEFTERFNLLRRFFYSRRPTTIAHSPLPSPAISHIHLLDDPGFGLLSVSLFHGSIARSVPATGRTLPGFIDASGSTTGSASRLSEFTTSVSACAITSAGGTVRVLWGYATGHIAFMVINDTIDKPRKPAAEFRICQFEEMHLGCVTDAVWMTEASDTSFGGEVIAVTGGFDGDVKIWNFSDASTPDIFWTSPHKPIDLRDPCIKVACNRALGIVVGVKRSGAVDVWLGFDASEQPSLQRIAVPSWRTGNATKVLALHIDPYTRAILVGFQGDVCFHRIDITPEAEEAGEKYRITAFGAPESGGILSCLHPCFTAQGSDGAKSFVLAGDKLGYVSVFPWDDLATSTETVRPSRSFQATYRPTPSPSKHRSSQAGAVSWKKQQQQQENAIAAITAITWTPTILATGTSAGSVLVWDSITFDRIKEVVTPAKLRRARRGGGHHAQQQQQAQQQGQAQQGMGFEVADNSIPDDSVKQIILSEKWDTLIVNVGGEVVMWNTGDTSGDGSRHSGKKVITGGKQKSGKYASVGESGRWSQQVAMKKAISESHALYLTDWDAHIDGENPDRKARRDNEKAHRKELEKLGMNEEEMLEYVLMMSRETQQASQGAVEKQGGSAVASGSGTAESATSAGAGASGDALTDEQVQVAIEGGLFTMDSPSGDAQTTSPSPPLDEAVSPSSSLPGSTSLLEGTGLKGLSSSDIHFPTISPPMSRSNSGGDSRNENGGSPPRVHPASLRNRKLSATSNCTSVSSSSSSSGSFKSAASRTSAWGVPLSVTPSSPSAAPGGSNRSAETSRGGRGAWDGLDDDLKFAIELSLAEARSRGEDV